MMNERIKELFLQAGFHPPVVKQMGDEYKFEKFAELIVRECAEVADNADATRQKWESISKYVREHFGVEE